MKTSCIQHPENNPLIIIRSWQLVFCHGCHCAAALLSVFEYWHNIKTDIRRKNIIANDIAEMHQDSRSQDETLLQFHNLNDLHKQIQFLYSKNTIQKSLEFLESKGVISIHSNPNPRYRFDKTRYFKFNPEIINHWLKNNAQLQWDPKLKTKFEDEEMATKDDLSANFVEESSTIEFEYSHHPNQQIDLSKLIDRDSKNDIRSTKSDIPSPNFDKAITIDYIPRLQTKKAAAENSENLQSAKMANINSSASAAHNLNNPKLPSLTLEEELIGNELTPTQMLFVQDRVRQLLPLFPQFGFEELQEHLIMELLEHSFSQCGQRFIKKLNTIRSLAMKKSWNGSDRIIVNKLQNKNEIKSNLLSQSDVIKQKIIDAESEIYSLKQHMANYFSKDDAVSKTFITEIEQLEVNVINWKNQLKEFQSNELNNDLSGQKISKNSSFEENRSIS